MQQFKQNHNERINRILNTYTTRVAPDLIFSNPSGPDLGLQIQPGPRPGPEVNVLELEFIHSTFICYCLHIQTETRMWVWPTRPWWNREVQITEFVKQWIPAQLHSEADASKDGQIRPHIRRPYTAGAGYGWILKFGRISAGAGYDIWCNRT